MFEHFPTTFALKVAFRVDLIAASNKESIKRLEREMSNPDSGYNEDDLIELYTRLNMLREFQELCVATDFEDALIAFHDAHLTEDQKAALLLIHKSTPTYIVGYITNTLLTQMQGSETYDMISIVSTVMSILKDRNISNPDKDRIKQVARKFVVQAIRPNQQAG